MIPTDRSIAGSCPKKHYQHCEANEKKCCRILNDGGEFEKLKVNSLFASSLEAVNSEEKQREDSRTNALIITSGQETLLKQYMLATIFGDVFLREGDPFYPLHVSQTLWEIPNRSVLEKVYRNTRQLVHGAYAKEEFIDLDYLKEKSQIGNY